MEEKKYYFLDDGIQIGPLTFTELKLSGIKQDTLVWYNGLSNWLKANELDEIKSMFSSTPPPPPTTNVSTGKQNSKSEPHASTPGLQNNKRDASVSVRVWKSSNRKSLPAFCMFMFVFFTFMGIALIAASNPQENTTGLGIVITFIGIIFLPLYFWAMSSGKEIYQIGVNHSENILWVNRPSERKIHKENWGNKIKSFHIEKSSSSRFVTAGNIGGVPKRVVTKKWELKVSLEGKDYLWPVPGSVFYAKKEADELIGKINMLL